MARYLLIESRDPFEVTGVRHDYELARSLASAGNEVTLFLVQNGVLPARRGASCAELEKVAKDGVEVLADDFSLGERGIPEATLPQGVHAAPLETVVDQLTEGRKAVWL